MTPKGLTKQIKNKWLKSRKDDKLNPTKNEIRTDFKSRPTLTFRQFVNFLIKCPKEVVGCGVSNIKDKFNTRCSDFFSFF